MTKYEIMALAMRAENQCEAEGVDVAVKIAAWLESAEPRLRDKEVADLIRLAGAVYRIGVQECGQAVPLEDLFAAQDNWPDGPVPMLDGFRHGHTQR